MNRARNAPFFPEQNVEQQAKWKREKSKQISERSDERRDNLYQVTQHQQQKECPNTNKHNVFLQHDFEVADAGSSLTYPLQCSALRKNGFVVIKGRPCKVVDMSTSKTGKHGHAKVHLVGLDIFTGRKYEDLSPSTHNVEVPFVKRTEFELLDIDDGYLNLMTDSGETKQDVKAPEGELGDKLQADFDDGKELIVTIVSAMDEEACISYREAPES